MIVVASLSLTLGATYSDAAGFNTPSTTSWPAWCPGAPSSLYDNPTQTSTVTQYFNGSIKGCFRVPDDRSSTLHVAWQTFVQLNDSPTGPTTTNGVSNSFTDGHFKLSLSATTVHPGEQVTVVGRYLTGRRPANSDNPDGILCWDGCQGGIQEQAQRFVWVTGKEFRTTLLVPDAPWFESSDGHSSVHPLTSGTDTVGIECVTVTSGCATQPADTEVDVHLVAPRATWCTATVPCGSLHVNSVHTSVGDVVEVRGRAPLAGIIGQPFGYWLAYQVKKFGHGVVSFHSPVTTETTATIAPRTLYVATGATWARQHLTPVVASSWSSVYPVAPTSNGTSIATCEPTSVAVTGNDRTFRIPTTSVGSVLVSHHLSIGGSKKAGSCAEAYVDPANSSHVFASFYSAQRGSIPPTYLAGLFTTDGGTTWRLVPTPPGHTSYDFGGFQPDGAGIAAVFMNSDEGNSPAKTTIVTEVTTNGGDSWTPSLLGCPKDGPCVIFGPSSPGNCAMNGEPEPVYFGVAHANHSATFETSRWITAVNACYSQQLVATASGTELLLDPSSLFPLVASRTDGRTWYNVQIPRLAGLGSAYQNGLLLMDQRDRLLATIANAKGATFLYLLAPHATSWCRAFELTKNDRSTVSPLRTSGDRVFWSVTRNNESTIAGPATVHVVPDASIRCP